MWIVEDDVDQIFIKMWVFVIHKFYLVEKSYAGCLSTGLIKYLQLLKYFDRFSTPLLLIRYIYKYRDRFIT